MVVASEYEPLFQVDAVVYSVLLLLSILRLLICKKPTLLHFIVLVHILGQTVHYGMAAYKPTFRRCVIFGL